MLRSWAAILLLPLVVACREQDPPRTATPPASATGTPGTSDGGPQDIAGEGTPLEPGTYTYSPFEPAVTFELGDGWEGGHTTPEFFEVWRGDRIAVMFARPGFLLDGEGERVDARRMSPDEAVSLLRQRGSTVRAPTMVLDGGAVPSIYLRTAEPTDLFGGPEGEFTSDPEFRNRIAAVVVDDALVLVVVSARTPIELDDRLAVIEMLGTIDLG